MRHLPAGSVTFLFTDIEGSTAHQHRLGPSAYAAELDRHSRAVHGAIGQGGGAVVKTMGDGVLAAFADASAAVRACVEAQRNLAATDWQGGEPLRVRMGMHTGPAEIENDDYRGLAVDLAARVSAAAHGDQIVVSAATAARAPSEDWRFERLGEYRLKGFAEPIIVHQVAATGLRAEFPPLRAPSVVNHNIPALPAPLVGRADDVAAVGRLLASERLVTLVGPGGIGKTSMAISAAEQAAPRQPGGAWWVELASVTDAELVPEVVGSALGILDAGGDAHSLIEHRLAVAPTLLVLDNCEHVAPAVNALLDRVIDRCPDVTVLATSRTALGHRRERVVVVPTLPEHAAVAILAARGGEHEPSTLVDIAHRLDGMPLALALVSAQLQELPAADVLAGLDAAGTGPALRASLDWSYDLLDDDAAACFRRLAAFAGACPLEAAAAVCGGPTDGPVRVVEILLDLADRSLIEVRRSEGGRRVHLLGMVRTYAQEHLDRDPADTPADRHLAWYRHLVSDVARLVLNPGPARSQTIECLSADVEDLRLALAHAARGGQGKAALLLGRVAGAVRNHEARYAEAVLCYQAAIAAGAGAGAGDDSDRARAMRELADTYFHTGDYVASERWATDALELARAAGAVEVEGYALVSLARRGTVGNDLARARSLLEAAEGPATRAGGDLAAQRLLGLALCTERDGDFQQALTLNKRAVALARDIADERLLGIALTNLANASICLGDFASAEATLRGAVDVLGPRASVTTRIHAVANLAYLAYRRGDLLAARELGRDVLTLARSSGHVFTLALGYNNLGEVELEVGDLDAAEAAFREGLRLGRTLGHTERICYCVEGLAMTASARADHDLAVTLLSAADRHRVTGRSALPDTYRASYESVLVDARSAMGVDAFTSAWRRGENLDIGDASELELVPRPGTSAR